MYILNITCRYDKNALGYILALSLEIILYFEVLRKCRKRQTLNKQKTSDLKIKFKFNLKAKSSVLNVL